MSTNSRDLHYGLLLFVFAVAVLGLLVMERGFLTGDYGLPTGLFFVVFGLFTITMGFPHPHMGHVSFDRVSQVAAILVLGPVDAAVINGLASLLYPWHRLQNGESLATVLAASLLNSGMMSLTILVSGTLYVTLGGAVPLGLLDIQAAGLLLVLLLSMQVCNDACMLGLFWLKRCDPKKLHTWFSSGVEIVSFLMAVVVALAFAKLDWPAFCLLLVVLSIGMLVLKRYAEVLHGLEALVEERTHELRLKSEELERQATHDKLTGLHNRRYADEFLSREIENAKRHGRELTIALADIDHFKRINDTYSHATGDEVLCRVAEIMRQRIRTTDMVARYGGEEFLLCFLDTGIEFADTICSEIRLAVANENWCDLLPENSARDTSCSPTISFGISAVGSDARRTTVLGEADTRLYTAKNRGRNRIVC